MDDTRFTNWRKSTRVVATPSSASKLRTPLACTVSATPSSVTPALFWLSIRRPGHRSSTHSSAASSAADLVTAQPSKRRGAWDPTPESTSFAMNWPTALTAWSSPTYR